MPRTITGDDPKAGVPYQDNEGDHHWNGNTQYVEAGVLDFGEGAIENIICSGTVAVTVPSVSDNDTGVVAVDVASAFTATIDVGDFVIAAPLAALPTDCSLAGAYVTAEDTVTVNFTAQDGAVTGAAVNFKFLVIKAAASA